MQEILNILGSVGFNWHVALANFVNFLIILFLLNKFFFGKIGKAIEKRHEVIEKGLQDASEAEKLAVKTEDEKHAILSLAKRESKAILEQAEVEASAILSTRKEEAEKEIERKKEDLLKKEASLSEKVEKDFMEKAPALVASLYKATLMKEMTEEENNALIGRMK